MYNELLRRQLTHHFGSLDNAPPEFRSLLEAVGTTYDRYQALKESIASLGLEDSRVTAALEQDDLIALAEVLIGQIAKTRDAGRKVKGSQVNPYALIENTADAIVSLDTRYRVVTFNPSFAKLVLDSNGKSPQGGMPFHDLLPSEKRTYFLSLCDRALSGERFTVEDSYCSRSDTGFFELSFSPLFSEGVTSGISIFAQDISERRYDEEIVKISEERFRSVWDNSRDGMRLTDDEGTILRVNQAFCRMVEKEGKDLEGQPLSSIYSTEEQTNVLYTYQSQFRTRIFQEYVEQEITLWNGKTVWFAVSNSVLEADVRPTLVLSIFRDITDRKRDEEDLRRYTKKLYEAKLQAEEQARMLNQQAKELIAAREAALEASRLKSEFVGNMSHEIRTPMNGVIGMTDILFESELTTEQRECVEVIRRSGETLLAVINDILDFSKIEAGNLELAFVNFDLHTVLDDVIGLFAQKAEEKKLKIASQLYSDVPTALHGDPKRMRQVLINLVGNAMKFTEKGGIVLHTKLQREESTRAILHFSVMDTGIGIPQTARSKLFVPFSQADGSTTRRFGGTGLGLMISKQLVEMMGGRIGFESEEGKGSTFWFTAVLEKQEEPSHLSVSSRDLSRLHVLIVGSDAQSREIIQGQVTSWGIRNAIAVDGHEALELLQQAAAEHDPYDIAIVDRDMPTTNGTELVKKIKAHHRLKKTACILVSPSTTLDISSTHDVSFAAVLPKPVRQSELFDCLMTVMENYATTEVQAPTLPPPRFAPSQMAHPVRVDGKWTARGDLRLLVVEDNLINQKVAGHILEKLGYRADIVSNGRQAVEALSIIPYDIVLMDCQMPEMDGFEATAEIRKRENNTQHTIIIAMTANALKGDREHCLEAGMDDYVSKPVKPEDLAAILEKWIPKRRQATE